MTRPGQPRSRLLVVGLGILALFGVVAVLAPVLSPYDPHAITGDALQPPSARHLLGTDDVGVDILSEVIWGTRSSLAVVVPAAALSVVIGVLVGVGPGLRGGVVDLVTLRIIDAFLALPGLPLVVLLAALAGPNRLAVVLVVGLAGWPPLARILRSQTISLRQRGYIAAAAGFGGSARYVVRRHLLPALAPTVAAGFIQWAGTAVVLEAGLAFLGLGDPTSVSWGSILNRALAHQGLLYGDLWLWWVAPAGLAVTVAIMGFTFVGVGLEPSFNPRWRRAL